MMNQEEPEEEAGTGPAPVPAPPKFLDKLLSELEREGPLPPVREANPAPRMIPPAPPMARSVDDEERPRKNTLLVVALSAALVINVALVVMMFTVLRDRSAEQPAVAAYADKTGITVPGSDKASTGILREEGGDAQAREVAPAFEDTLPEDAVATPPPAVVMPLAISKLALCREIRGYGEYDPIPDGPLFPHHVPQMQAYIEMAHPKPEPREDGRYIYYLTVATRLYPSGDPFAEPLIDKAVSLVVNGTSPREDFHSAQPLQVNRRVGPGEYTLLVRVTDQISGETARAETRFRVQGGQP